MRNASLEERISYRRKTWGEEWNHKLEEPEIRAHVLATRQFEERLQLAHTASTLSPAEFFGVVFGTGSLKKELHICDCSREAKRLLHSLRQSAQRLRNRFAERSLRENLQQANLLRQQLPPLRLRPRKPLPQDQPSLSSLITPGRLTAPNFSLNCRDV
jgi:hypothetical protein